ncbi:hypothetical protein B9G98_02581 [Wickerhamiella sorbophila]|uniref:Peptidase S59 domain-containing protein n=1 Tax=Wickerhamiella sorbophila TaxID=45607 RepID=A0A2T0FIY7_9ASCO|nr:hypothetical protein B9G98_02581 [Wickerhamiella sorbophila]PRT54961.1 hypothetical protein B9G98_02581 [Wickerhamiella sorbophila]
MNGGGLFNQTATNSASTFGQPQTQNQTPSFGGFGTSSTTSQGGLFGQQKTGGLFGSNTTAQPGQAPTATSSSSAPSTPSLFGSNPSITTTTTQPSSLFGNKPAPTGSSLFAAPAPSQPSGGLFGAKPAATGTGLFGNASASADAKPASTGTNLFGTGTAAPGTTTSSTGTGLFGNNTAQSSSTGGLFGNSTANTSTIGTTSLFGKPAAAGTSTGTGLFGSTPSASSGLLGGTSAPTTGTGMFGSSTNQTGSLFGKAAAPTTGGAAPTTGVSIFGSSIQSTPMNGLGNASASTSTTQPVAGLFGSSSNGAAGRLFATIEQPSYTLPGSQSNGSPKLYKSLTAGMAQTAKENGRSAPAVKLAVASAPSVSTTEKSSLPIKRSSEHQQDTRKLLNSYEKYIKDRPTNLIIRRAKRPALAISAPASKLAIENGSAQQTMENSVNGTLETTVAQSLADSTLPSADISLFHKQAQTVTLVRVNKAALEQGYFIRPGLDELASYSKEQLKAVPNLVIGRDNFGQLLYSDPIDLSGIENLGDILGKLVVFDEGTVCVYPDDRKKVERGKELNVPCTVTIENAFPRDTQGKLILSMADPRMAKHVAKLRKANESRGAEFITFSHGVWVFKVPHFSMWGLPVDEMVVDDDYADENSADEHEQLSVEINGVSRPTESVAVKFESVQPSVRSNPVIPTVAQEPLTSVGFFPRTSTPDFVADEMQIVTDSQPSKPRTWVDVLANSYLLEASEGAVAEASAVDGSLTANDLNRILYGAKDDRVSAYEKLRRPPTLFTSNSMLKKAPTISGVGKVMVKDATSLDTGILKSFVTKAGRSAAAGGLMRLATNVTFADLQIIFPHPLWPVCSVIFDGSSGVTRRERLSAWLVEQTSKAVNRDLSAAEDDFDAIWILICGYRLEDAAVRAISSGNPHLATLISQLGSPAARAAAQAQLKEWRSSDAIFFIPSKVRAIYELASGNVGLVPAYSANGQRVAELDLTEGLDWKNVLGLKLWYGMPEVEIDNIIATLPDSDDSEFVFLRLVCQPSVLNQIDTLVGLPTAFLALQALKNIPRESHTIDNICVQLSYELLESSQLTSAVFVALHIVDDRLALIVVKDILMRSPWSLSSSFAAELDLPKQLVLESQALYAHYAQNYIKESELLIEAELFDDAHKVLITLVAPQAVIRNDYHTVEQLLQRIPPTVNGWKLGGKVYLDYSKFINKPTSELALTLCSALQTIATFNVEHKAAVAIMAGQVASQGRMSLMTPQILKMKLGSSQYRLQAMQQAAVDLIQM